MYVFHFFGQKFFPLLIVLFEFFSCKEIECVGLSGTDAFKEVRIQSVVVEFLLNHVDILFSDSFTSVGKSCAGKCTENILLLTSSRSILGSTLC